MSEIRMTGLDDGEVALSGPVSQRILEDGGTTAPVQGRADTKPDLRPHRATSDGQQSQHWQRVLPGQGEWDEYSRSR
jgi:hypothetical protein